LKNQLAKRNEKGQFVKGVSGNPEGKKTDDNIALLERSIERAEKITGKHILSHYVNRAYVSSRVIISLLNKLIPNKRPSENNDNQPEEIVLHFKSSRTIEEKEFLKVWRDYS
jgi:hypothetical protein